MRTLYLVRHAYTPNTVTDKDFDRTIKQEEHLHTKKLSSNVKKCLEKIDFIFCSNAIRTKQTQIMLQPYFTNNPVVSYCDILYNRKDAYSEIVWDLLKKVPNSKQHVMIIGHNPGLTDFYNNLSVPNYEFIHFPTLGVATIQFYEQTNWKTVNASSAIERSIYIA